MRRLSSLFIVLSLAVALLAGCSGMREAPPENDDLYQSLGGESGIHALITQMLVNATEDQRIAHHFVDTNIERLREKLVEHLCMLTGGPCEYTGDSMRQSHAHLELTMADFNALVEDLQRAMEQQNVPIGARNRLLARLARLHDEVVAPGTGV